jgi:hypothetical protein
MTTTESKFDFPCPHCGKEAPGTISEAHLDDAEACGCGKPALYHDKQWSPEEQAAILAIDGSPLGPEFKEAIKAGLADGSLYIKSR